MTSTIYDTVQASMSPAAQAEYLPLAEPIIAALVDRERHISERLLDFAADVGLNVAEARQYLVEMGMAVAEGQPRTGTENRFYREPTQPSGVGELLAGLTAKVEALTRFARANGFRD